MGHRNGVDADRYDEYYIAVDHKEGSGSIVLVRDQTNTFLFDGSADPRVVVYDRTTIYTVWWHRLRIPHGFLQWFAEDYIATPDTNTVKCAVDQKVLSRYETKPNVIASGFKKIIQKLPSGVKVDSIVVGPGDVYYAEYNGDIVHAFLLGQDTPALYTVYQPLSLDDTDYMHLQNHADLDSLSYTPPNTDVALIQHRDMINGELMGRTYKYLMFTNDVEHTTICIDEEGYLVAHGLVIDNQQSSWAAFHRPFHGELNLTDFQHAYDVDALRAVVRLQHTRMTVRNPDKVMCNVIIKPHDTTALEVQHFRVTAKLETITGKVQKILNRCYNRWYGGTARFTKTHGGGGTKP